MKILAFAGSNSTVSINKKLVTFASTFFSENEVEILDLNDYEMPIYKREIELELVKNGKTIERQIVQPDKRQRLCWVLIGIGLGIGAFKLLNLII